MHKANLSMWMMLAAMATTSEPTPGPKGYAPGSTPPNPKPRRKPAPLPPADPEAVARAMAIPPHETRTQRREREQIAKARRSFSPTNLNPPVWFESTDEFKPSGF